MAMRCSFVLLLCLLTATKWRSVSSQYLCRPDISKVDCGYSDKYQCEATGCCYDPTIDPTCYHSTVVPPNPQCNVNVTRIPCGLPLITSEDECGASGCCWDKVDSKPNCFFASPKYIVQSVTKDDNGLKLILKNSLTGGANGQSASPISPLLVEVTRETLTRLHIKISDPNNKRYEIPESILPTPPPPAQPLTGYYFYDYDFAAEGEEFYMIIRRRSNSEVLFNTTSHDLIFADQFLTIGTDLPLGYNIYGLGEHKTSLRLKPRGYTLWNYDVPTPENLNLYGSHPFYMEMRRGRAHGVFLKNSNGMDVILNTTSLTYKVIGGVLDFYFFVSELSLPDDIIHSYHDVIGRPAMPPYWALGYHQCRWGYNNLQEVKDVVNQFESNQIPLEAVWFDIDYMDEYKDFTIDPKGFQVDGVKEFISSLHKQGKRLVLIVDPAISSVSAQGYQPYQDGVDMDVFIKDSANQIFHGKVWPGVTAYPDFLHPNATHYWTSQISKFMQNLSTDGNPSVDGLWIDMNEPSNFCNGDCYRDQYSKMNRSQLVGAGAFGLFYPPYSINSQDQMESLNHKTLDVETKQFGGLLHYDTHNLYGMTESIATRKALLDINKGKRPFVLSRSTFSGSGAYAAHWLGDNTASAEDLYYSIPGILNFQMFGIPMVGADICGFGGNTSEELCNRWMSVGAFYPFSRNHNIKGGNSQEPYQWKTVTNVTKNFFALRYSLLPYYYTLFYKAHHDPTDINVYLPSAMVLKPLFFEFPQDNRTLDIDTQFLVGSGLLISPQLKLGSDGKGVNLYFPPASKWYDWFSYVAVDKTSNGMVYIETPLYHIPIHIRGGQIIPMQEPGLTTTESRKNPYSLLVALDPQAAAMGDLYLDDGETVNTTEYTYVTYTCEGSQLAGYAHGTGYASKHNLSLLVNVTIIGLPSTPKVVSLDGKVVKFAVSYAKDTIIASVTGLGITMDTSFKLNWI